MTLKNMRINEVEIKQRKVWLVIDQLKIHSPNFSKLESKPEFLCYFNLTEPNSMIIGELLKDEEGKVILFKSPDEAINRAVEVLNKRL